MINIAICDDESIYGNELKSKVEEYLYELNVACDVDMYNSGTSLIEAGVAMAKYQLIFLDMSMDDLNGMETAYRIRERLEDTTIVFVTAFINYSLEAYKVKAFRYLVKVAVNFDETLKECLDAFLEERNVVEQIKTLPFLEEEKTFHLKQLLYVESNLHKLTFAILEERVVMYTILDTLNHMEAALMDECLLRIHQSYLVNLRYVDRIEGRNVVLTNDKMLPIAKSRFSKVKKTIYQYKGGLMC